MNDMIKALAVGAMVSAPAASAIAQIQYPQAPSDGTVYEAFGLKVNDNYRPLENDTAAATLAWVKAENKITDSYMSRVRYRGDIKARLKVLNSYLKSGAPSLENDGMYYFFENDGLRNQSVLYRQATPTSSAEVFIDPNQLSADGTVALKGVYQSHDGRYTAYTVSRNGSDWVEIFVMETQSRKLLDDHIVWAKFTGAEWHGDGFYYSAYDRPEAGKEFSNANEYHRVYYHKLGTPQQADELVFEDREQSLHFHSVGVSNDDTALFIYGSGEGNGNSLMVRDLRQGDDAPWLVVEATQSYEIAPIDVVDGMIYMLTSDNAPKYRVVKAPLSAPQKANWVEVVPEGDGVLVGATFAGDKLVVTYDRDASHHAFVVDADGRVLREIKFPACGSVSFSASRKQPEVFYEFTSFTYPRSVYSYDMTTGESSLLKTSAIEGFNPDDYVTEQVFYTSKDGTRVPMFIVYRRGLKRDGSNPVYLYGYGGFNVPLNPGFSANRLLWLENGGIYAQANLRGGSEYGEAWHEAGTRMNKVNVFDDFIAAAEYMITEGWTTRERLVIEGGSNGGLLVGACVNMRPDLFAVAIPRVGVMDMMRYHLFTIGWNWAHDYGTADDSLEMARYLLDYSPIHNIRNDGTPYPAILVTTADHDDRVVPAHSFKYAATLQAADTGVRPKLIRIDSNAGHGAGKPMEKIIDEWTDMYSFIYYNLGIEPDIKK